MASSTPRPLVSMTTLGGFLGAAIRTNDRSTSRDGASGEAESSWNDSSTELEVLRDQHRAMRLAQHSLMTEVVTLRVRCEQAEEETRHQVHNATQLAHALASCERLRLRATAEASDLRLKFRDALARIAELEARLAIPTNNSVTSIGKLTTPERALRIHTRRRELTHTPTNKTLARPPAAPPPPPPPSRLQLPVQDPVVVKLRRPVVLMPEYGRPHPAVARAKVAAATPPATESLVAKLERGSKLYRQLQTELVMRQLGHRENGAFNKQEQQQQQLGDSLFSTVPERAVAAATSPIQTNAGATTPSHTESIRDKLLRGSALYQDLQHDMVKKKVMSQRQQARQDDLPQYSPGAIRQPSLADFYSDAAYYKIHSQQPP